MLFSTDNASKLNSIKLFKRSRQTWFIHLQEFYITMLCTNCNFTNCIFMASLHTKIASISFCILCLTVWYFMLCLASEWWTIFHHLIRSLHGRSLQASHFQRPTSPSCQYVHLVSYSVSLKVFQPKQCMRSELLMASSSKTMVRIHRAIQSQSCACTYHFSVCFTFKRNWCLYVCDNQWASTYKWHTFCLTRIHQICGYAAFHG